VDFPVQTLLSARVILYELWNDNDAGEATGNVPIEAMIPFKGTAASTA
jgi:hypothetical protein